MGGQGSPAPSHEHTGERSKTKIDVYIESPRGDFCPA